MLKKMEREKFVGGFNQAKNLIEKQMKIGMQIQSQRKRKDEKKAVMQTIKTERKETRNVETVKMKQYGAFSTLEVGDGGGDFST